MNRLILIVFFFIPARAFCANSFTKIAIDSICNSIDKSDSTAKKILMKVSLRPAFGKNDFNKYFIDTVNNNFLKVIEWHEYGDAGSWYYFVDGNLLKVLIKQKKKDVFIILASVYFQGNKILYKEDKFLLIKDTKYLITHSKRFVEFASTILSKDAEEHAKDNLDILKNNSNVLTTGWYYVTDSSNNFKLQLDKSDEIYFLDPKPIVTPKNILAFEIYENSYNGKKYLGLIMRLDKQGTDNWSYATRKAEVYKMKLAFILDNRLLQIAIVNSQITGGVTALNRADYSRQELENFKRIIENEK